ncbi:ribonuclease H-like domain-containing protein [Mycena vulgaris]|nr:ribonuclease H-like domain-containing protein [Mycena vulgaris]
MASDKSPIWAYFWPQPGTNVSHQRAACKACVAHILKYPPAELQEAPPLPVDPASVKACFNHACEHAGTCNGVLPSMAAYILGYRGKAPCSHSSTDGVAEARKVQAEIADRKKDSAGNGKRSRDSAGDGDEAQAGSTQTTASPPPAKRSRSGQSQSHLHIVVAKDLPYQPHEISGIQKQACRAIISSNAAYRLFENEEMRKLFDMICRGTSDILPSGKSASGGLLDMCAKDAEAELKSIFKGREVGASTDGWKGQKRNSVNGVCGNVDFKAYPLQLVDTTACAKDGPGMCKQFCEIIDFIEKEYNCTVIYFVTDADSGSLKGRKLLQKLCPWLFIPSCWAHQSQLILGDYFKSWDYAQHIAEKATAVIGWINLHSKVHVIFDDAQKELGAAVALAYLVACITRWTTHFVAFMWLLQLQTPLQKAVAWKRDQIVKAQVGVAKSTEKQHLEEDATHHCDIIDDATFWNGLEQVVGDIEVICLATNLNQKDSTRADQVLLSLAGVFLRFFEHPEEEVKKAMTTRIEKRWGDCDQLLFILALILNSWEQLSCFDEGANLDHFLLTDFAIQMYRCLGLRPGSKHSVDGEKKVDKAMGDYLAGIGCFRAWDDRVKRGEMLSIDEDPIAFWKGYLKTDTKELAELAATIFSIVVNQAGVERLFSFIKEHTKDRHNRLGLPKTEKALKIDAKIRSEHRKAGLIKTRQVRHNHKAASTLLDVPRYANLLQDQADKDPSECGRTLVQSAEGWHTKMACWIADTQEAEAEGDEENDKEDVPVVPNPPRLSQLRAPRKWKPISLERLFAKTAKESLRARRGERMARRAQEEEQMYMQVMAELDAADSTPDDGEVEIDDSEVYGE